jgi:hypothetical protein
MATAWMQCDQMAINRINPYTASGTYGVNTDGFPKSLPMDGTAYTTQIDETPMDLGDRPELDNEMNFNFSGSMYLKTSDTSPAPFRPFPARKYEYADGTTTWHRPYLPWTWEGGARKNLSMEAITEFFNDNSFLFILILIVLALFVLSKKK